MSSATPKQTYMEQNTNAPAYWQVGILWAMLATSDQTNGQFSLMEEWCPKNSGPPPHYHDQDEAFYLIEGNITFLAGGQTLQASSGGFVSIPAGTVHSFRVDSETAHVLNFYSPAGFEQVVMQLGVPAQARIIPPKDFKEPSPDMPKMMKLFQQYGMHVVQEPDVLRQRQ